MSLELQWMDKGRSLVENEKLHKATFKMAKQKGIIKIQGKIGELSFYTTKDGNLVREKGGIDAKRIASDPAFKRTRENGAEFGSSASSGKLIRDAFRPLIHHASDQRVTARMMKIMTEIKNLDTVSPRGKRNVGIGITNPLSLNLLKGFNFNIHSVLVSVMYKPFTVDQATGEISILELNPMNDLTFPEGATHMTIQSAWAKIDFVTKSKVVEISDPYNGPIDGNTVDVVLTPQQVPGGVGTNFQLLMIEFFQEVNGVQYTLNNGSFNSASIIDVY